MVGAIFWNYLSVVFSWIAETIAVERWEGTLEYTMMAPIRRTSRLIGQVAYAMVYGLVHTAAIFIVLAVFFRNLDLSAANPVTAVVFMVLGSFSFVGIGILAAILPLLYVERGAQMTFVLQSCLLLVSGVYYSIDILPPWMQVLAHLSPATYVLAGVRAGVVDGTPVSELTSLIWPLIVMGVVLIPLGLVGVRTGGALCQAHRQAEARRLTPGLARSAGLRPAIRPGRHAPGARRRGCSPRRTRAA